MADILQVCGLLYKHKFGSVKGRSAAEAVLRTVTRAQQCLGKEVVVGWGLWDVKGGFPNVKEEDIIRELEKLEEGRKWILVVKGFFKARRFDLKRDGKMKGRGKTNLVAA